MKKIILIFFLIIFTLAAYTNQNARDLFNKAKWEMRRGNLYSAIHFFKNALKINPYYRQCYEGLGQIYMRLSNYQEAYKHINEALRFDMNNVENLVDMAKIRMKLSKNPGEILSAEYFLQRAFNLEPRNKRLLVTYGDYHNKRGFFDKAIEFYRKALIVDERDFQVYVRLSKSYLAKGDKNTSHKYMRQAEEINSRSEISNYELGVFYYKEKDFDKAEKYFRIAISIKANFINAHHYLIKVYFQKRDWDKAIHYLNRLRRLTPRDYLVYYHLGIAMAELGSMNNDTPFIESAMEVFKIGLINRVSDDMTRLMAEEIAIRTLKIGNKYRTEFADHYWKTANDYITLNLIDNAILALKRGIRLEPKSVRFRHKLATIYRRQGYIDRFYRELLLIQRDIDANDRNVNDDLLFMRNRIIDTLAYKENIRQYEIDRPRPKIVFSKLSENSIYSRKHLGISPVVRELLHQSLLLKGKLNVEALSNPRESESIATRNLDADILLKGNIVEEADSLTVNIELVTTSTGNTFASFSVTKKGNNRITQSALDLSERISKAIPVFGRIIRLSNYQAIINIGRMQGYKKGDEFEIYRSQRIVRDLLSGYPIQKQGELLGSMKIIDAGEMISKVDLSIDRHIVFNSINLNDVIVFKPKQNQQQQARAQ